MPSIAPFAPACNAVLQRTVSRDANMSKTIIAFLVLIIVLTGVWAVSALGTSTLSTIVVIWLLIAAAIGAWIASEYQDRRSLRLSMGTVALLTSFLVAFVVGMAEMFSANAWFGSATKTLIETTISELEDGNTTVVIRELKRLSAEYEPTYENRARYDVLVEDTVSRMRSAENEQEAR